MDFYDILHTCVYSGLTLGDFDVMEIGEITDYLHAANKFHQSQQKAEKKQRGQKTNTVQGSYSDFQRLMG